MLAEERGALRPGELRRRRFTPVDSVRLTQGPWQPVACLKGARVWSEGCGWPWWVHAGVSGLWEVGNRRRGQVLSY